MLLIARGLSVLFHPVFMFMYGLISFAYLSPTFTYSVNSKVFLWILLLAFAFTVLAPVSFTYVSLRKLELDKLSDRRQSLSAAILFYSLAYMLGKQVLPTTLESYLLSIVLIQIGAFFLSIRTKVSLHAAGQGGFVAFMLYSLVEFPTYFYWPFMASLLLAGLIMSCRLLLSAHNPKEAYTGLGLGFCIGLAVFALNNIT